MTKSIQILGIITLLFSLHAQASYSVCNDPVFKEAAREAQRYNYLFDQWYSRYYSGATNAQEPVQPDAYGAGMTYINYGCPAVGSKSSKVDENVWSLDPDATSTALGERRINAEILNDDGQALLLSCNPENPNQMAVAIFFEPSEVGENKVNDFDLVYQNSEQLELSMEIDGDEPTVEVREKQVSFMSNQDWMPVRTADVDVVTTTMMKHSEEGSVLLNALQAGWVTEIIFHLRGVDSFKKTMSFSLNGSKKTIDTWSSQCKNPDPRPGPRVLPF